MPIEIKELYVRFTVNAPDEAGSQIPQPRAEDHAANKEAIVAECVEQVLQILQEKKER